MLFPCPPSELVSYILETLSFLGQHGLTLNELWTIVSKYLHGQEKDGIKVEEPTIDSFQQQCIWQWLFFSLDEDKSWKMYVELNGKPLVILPSYKEFIETSGDANTIRIKPTPDTQWKYLTGLEPLKKLKLQLGEKPLELLCVIAKHGRAGILSPDLVREANQDPRSLPSRFKKLEEMNLIVKTSVYSDKSHQHTNHIVHTKFAQQVPAAADLSTSRRSYTLKQLIINSAKNATNQLRGFHDLKVELNMLSKTSGSKLFGDIVESLHRQGYVEKVMVKEKETDLAIYAIKYLKDLPKDLNTSRDFVEVYTSEKNDDESSSLVSTPGLPDDYETFPTFNTFFPIVSQIHQSIVSNETGITSKEVVRNISGVSGFRPWVRLLDNLASYVVDGTQLVPLKHYPDYYDDISIVRSFDFEGKFKVYRYYTKKNHQDKTVKPHKSEKIDTGKVQKKSLSELTESLYVPLDKVAGGSFIKVKKPSSTTLKKRTTSTPSRQTKKQKLVEEASKDVEETGSTEVTEVSTDNAPIKEEEDSVGRVVSIDTVKPIIPEIEETKKKARRLAKAFGSIKGQKRRNELLAIVKDFGGVTYTTARLCRILDQRLGQNTSTDMKTLARDICILASNNDLELRDVQFMRAGRQVSRKILILTDPKLRPPVTKIEEIERECTKDVGDRPMPVDVRVIEGEVVLYLSNQKKRLRTKDRLGSLDTPTPHREKPKRKRKQAKNVVKTPEVEENTIPVYVSKKHRRKAQPKKRLEKKASSGEPRRIRTVFKFDKADATTLFRAIVISKALRRRVIDYDEIASLFPDIDTKSIKQKWSVVRKLVGGLQAVTKGIEAFERIVLKGIEEELVSAEDLENIKLPFFLDLWKDADGTFLESEVDRTPLFSTVEDNLKEYLKVEVSEAGSGDLFEHLEDNSMRQKEGILSAVPFFLNDSSYNIVPKQHDDLRTVLKAIFSTKEENFSAYRVKKILSTFGDDAVHEASSALIKDKEMIYYGLDDADSKFMLTDKVYNALSLKISPKIFNQAARFEEQLCSIIQDKKGLILSQNVSSGDMALLFQLASNQVINFVHVDKTYNFTGYESRLIDKEKLSCDIVVVGDTKNKHSVAEDPKSVPVPSGKACSRIWLDLNGNINQEMWIKIVNVVLYHIHFRPGIPRGSVYSKVNTALGARDFHHVIQWLLDSDCIREGEYSGLWTTGKWYGVIGY